VQKNGSGKTSPDVTGLDGFDACYDRHQIEATVVMTDFCMAYLRQVYSAFDGDLTAALLLGEVGQENARRFVEQNDGNGISFHEVAARGLRGVSALSAAMASGVPRETARRKLKDLEAKGWIALDVDGMYVATDAAAEHFCSDFNRMLCQRMLATSHRLRLLLDGGADGVASGRARAPQAGALPGLLDGCGTGERS
jgi:hypothetical protein